MTEHPPDHNVRPRSDEERALETDREHRILTGMDLARRQRRPIDSQTAQLIALFLSTTPGSALNSYAENGYGRNRDLREEYLPIYHDPNTPAAVREVIDWFGALLVTTENSDLDRRVQQPPGAPKLRNLLWQTTLGDPTNPLHVSVRADTPNSTLQTLPACLEALLSQHGDAFRAFLLLADVDATAPDLESAFADTFYSDFATRNELIDGITEIDQFREQLRNIQETYIGGEYVTLDRLGLWRHLNEHWDIVHLNGQYYVFNR